MIRQHENFWIIIKRVRNLKVFDPFFIPHFIALSVAQLIRSESYSLSGTTEYTLVVYLPLGIYKPFLVDRYVEQIKFQKNKMYMIKLFVKKSVQKMTILWTLFLTVRINWFSRF